MSFDQTFSNRKIKHFYIIEIYMFFFQCPLIEENVLYEYFLRDLFDAWL
mgnify:FL=1